MGVYCLALVPANTLPKTPLGGIHLSETKQLFLEGSLHPCNVLMCPHTCVTNLPKPRQKQPGKMSGSKWIVAFSVCLWYSKEWNQITVNGGENQLHQLFMLSILGSIYAEYVQKEKCCKMLFINKGEISAALKGHSWRSSHSPGLLCLKYMNWDWNRKTASK